METMCKSQVLKKIHDVPDCTSEFILINLEVNEEDKEYMIKECNRIFRLYQIGMKALDVRFAKQIEW